MTTSLATLTADDQPAAPASPLPALWRLIGALGPGRLAVLAASALVLLGLFAFLLVRVSEPRLTLLFGELDPAAAREIVGRLEALDVAHALSADGRAVMVPAGEAPRLRLQLAEGGLPQGGPAGYEILDGINPLTSSDFLANVSLRRALEGELARTIAALRGVREARVHLVQPKRELFERESRQPTASVFLALRGAGGIEPRQVQSIRHLVAAAVPGLTADHVTIVDDRGVLLARATTPDGTGQDAPVELDEARSAFESRLRTKILSILERSVGVGKALVEVSADLDFDGESTTIESFDPQSQVARSAHAIEEATDRNERAQDTPVTVTTNLPTERTQSSSGPASAERSNRSEETTNFEISRTVRNHVRKGPRIRRLSIAVQVDTAAAGGGTEQLEALVRGAAGAEEERGDVVQIVARNLAPVEAGPEGTSSALPLFGLEPTRLLEIAALIALSAGVVLFGLRPIARELSRPAAVAAATEGLPAGGLPGGIDLDGGVGGDAEAGGPADVQAIALESRSPDLLGTSPGALMLESPDGSERARLFAEVRAVIDERPEDAVRVLRAWLEGE